MFKHHHKIVLCCLFILSLIFTLGTVGLASAQGGAAPDSAKAAEILTELNAWRLQEGLWPLKLNPTLQALAEGQAIHLAELPTFPEDYTLIHQDSNGRSPGERAIAEPHNWPKYMPISQAAIGENAAFGSVRSAFRFWRGSEIHSTASVNPGYREVGIGAVQRGTDTVFIVVFGSRPNVFPATLNPADGLIYLSNERFRWAPNSNAIQNVTQIRLFNAEGLPLTADWQPWSPSIEVPPNAGDRLFILLTDGKQQTLTEVTLTDNPQPAPEGNPLVFAQPTASTGGATFNLPGAEAGGASTTAFSFSATAVPTLQPTSVPLVFATPVPGAASPDVSLLYDDRSLFLVNTTGGTVNLNGMSIVGSGRTLTLERWAQFAGNLNLGAYPAGHCLQAEQSGTNAAAPGLCRSVRSVVEYQPGQVFWASGPFTVMRGNQTLATCQPTAGRCEVDLG
jgi:uncharacterized protein YkwD